MKCPRCGLSAAFKVIESRRNEEGFWRIRTCGACFKPFTTLETSPPELRMPWAEIMRSRRALKPQKRQQPARAPRGTAAHLQALLSREASGQPRPADDPLGGGDLPGDGGAVGGE